MVIVPVIGFVCIDLHVDNKNFGVCLIYAPNNYKERLNMLNWMAMNLKNIRWIRREYYNVVNWMDYQ